MRESTRRVLFLQATEAGGYPPIINAASVMAAAGWQVLILNAPIRGHDITFPRDCRIAIRHIPARPSHVMRKRDYARYLLATARLATLFRPSIIYASDPLGAVPGLLASRISGGRLVYHEHDSPNPGALNSKLMRFRVRAASAARAVVFPNAARAKIAQEELGFRDEQLRIVWNVPRRCELPFLPSGREGKFILYYHGSITPERLPFAVVDALAETGAGVKLWIMGYEAPGAGGYLARLLEHGRRHGADMVEYFGQVPTREFLFERAAQACVGLALMPPRSSDVNMQYMTGASNKAFDYMASGLALLVSDLQDWNDEFVRPGYARACDPRDSGSIAAQIKWFAGSPAECRNMGARGRARIESDWNYETLFRPVLESMESAASGT